MFSEWMCTLWALLILAARLTEAQSVSPEQCSSLNAVAATQDPYQRSSQSDTCSSQVRYTTPLPVIVTQTISQYTTLTEDFSTTVTYMTSVTVTSTVTEVTTVLYGNGFLRDRFPRPALNARQTFGPPSNDYTSSICSCLGVTGPPTPTVTSQITQTVTDLTSTTDVATTTLAQTCFETMTVTSTFASTPDRSTMTIGLL